MKLLNTIVKGTILSILVFFSISFLTVLFQINSPLNRIKDYYELKIGYPLTYYHEFMVDCPIPNSGWSLNHLFWDCLIVWILVLGIVFVRKAIIKRVTRRNS